MDVVRRNPRPQTRTELKIRYTAAATLSIPSSEIQITIMLIFLSWLLTFPTMVNVFNVHI